MPLRYEIADPSETISINVKLTDTNGSPVPGAELVTISGSTITSLGSITAEGIDASSNLMSLHLVPPKDFSGQLLAKLTPTITDGSVSTAFSEQTISVTVIDRADPIEFSNPDPSDDVASGGESAASVAGVSLLSRSGDSLGAFSIDNGLMASATG